MLHKIYNRPFDMKFNGFVHSINMIENVIDNSGDNSL